MIVPACQPGVRLQCPSSPARGPVTACDQWAVNQFLYDLGTRSPAPTASVPLPVVGRDCRVWYPRYF